MLFSQKKKDEISFKNVDGLISKSTKIVNGLLLILDRKINDKQFKVWTLRTIVAKWKFQESKKKLIVEERWFFYWFKIFYNEYIGVYMTLYVTAIEFERTKDILILSTVIRSYISQNILLDSHMLVLRTLSWWRFPSITNLWNP